MASPRAPPATASSSRRRSCSIVGGGDTAMEEAIFLTKFAARVHVVAPPRSAPRLEIMQERARRNPKIGFIWTTVVEEILGQPSTGGVTGARLRNVKTNELTEFKCDGVYHGHRPPAEHRAVQKPARDGRQTATSSPKGRAPTPASTGCCLRDVQDPSTGQPVTAAGSGLHGKRSTPSAGWKRSTAEERPSAAASRRRGRGTVRGSASLPSAQLSTQSVHTLKECGVGAGSNVWSGGVPSLLVSTRPSDSNKKIRPKSCTVICPALRAELPGEELQAFDGRQGDRPAEAVCVHLSEISTP